MAAELYSKLKKLKVVVQLVDDRIDLQAPKNVLNAELLNEIKENKEALIALLVSYKNNNKKHTYIEQVSVEDDYVLSSAQHRLWILSQFEESNTAYNVPGAYVFTGNLNIEALRDAFTALIDRHEILRTVFKQNDQEEVRQVILSSEDIRFHLEYKDIRNEAKQKEILERVVQSVFTLPFNLEKGPLLRAVVYQTEANQFVFAYALHHIISDGWSMGIFMKELLFLYNSNIDSNSAHLPPLRIQYKDYSAWQQTQLNAENLKGHETYWLKQFEGELPVFDLMPGLVRPSLQTYNGGSVYKKIDAETSAGLKKISQDQGATLFMGALALVNALIYRYNNQEDLIIGTPIAGREHSDLENQIGFYINTLALRTRFKSDDSFVSLLKNVQEVTLGAYEHQIYPFDELVDSLHLHRDMSRNPLFDVMVTVQHSESKESNEQQLGDLQVNQYEGTTGVISKFDLTFNFVDSGEELSFDLEYNSDIYSEQIANQLANHLVGLIQAIVKKPTLEILKLDYLSESEKENLLVTFNTTAVRYPKNKNVVDLFEDQAAAIPDSIALIFEEKKLTYKELNEKSNQFAAYLKRNYKVKPNDLIGVELEKNEWAIISILAVLKSSGAYVPIDPIYPQDRKKFMYADSGCKLVIDEKELKKFKAELEKYSVENLNVVNIESDLAYVIYTSGTTGNPKGVMIEHKSFFDYISTFERTFKINEKDRCIQQSSFSFDTHVEEIYPVLIKGGTILMGRNGGQDIQELQRLIEKKGATIISATPLVLSELNNCDLDLSNLRLMISGGDVFNASYVNNFLNKIDIYDSYGPSESTVCCTYFKIEDTQKSSIIGKPINNRKIYILNDQNQLSPIGVRGEICIGGTGLARGYLNRPELTSEKFVNNPFAKGERMYKTGDLGRWLPDGNIQFLGRKDDQVKIRGYRIELGEIENVLQGYPEVESSVVIAVTSANGQKELAAYIVSSEVLNSSDLQGYLNTKLPKYMIPSHFVQMEQLPLTSNGKIDKKKLLTSNFTSIASGIEYIAPRNETEEKLLSIWQEVLKRDVISVKDNFFDLGGQSISATRLSMQIHKVFNNKPALKDLFTFSVLEDQAKWIQQSKATLYNDIPLISEAKDYLLSAGQKRLWILSQFEETNTAYNMPGVYVFTGDLNIEALGNAFLKLIDRHEILRTVFKQNDQEEVRQFILSSEDIGFHLEYKDIRKESKPREVLEKEVQSIFGLPFNLEKGPLLRAAVYQTEANQFVFAYAMHHIISDGWSMGILIKELLHLYNNGDSKSAVLPVLPIQYKDYSAWQNQQLSAEDLKGHKGYWLNQFEGTLPVLELGQGNVRPAVQTFNGGTVSKNITPQTTAGIKKISQEEGGTLFMGVLAVVNTLLYRYSNQQDIIIGSPIAGREHADLENQIGFYVNTLALRTRFKTEDNFINLLKEVKEVTLGAYEHQVYPFDELVDALNLHRDMSRNPLFDVMVMLQNNESNQESNPSLGDLQVSSYEGSTAVVSKFDFTFNFEDLGDTLSVSLEYNSDIYTQKIADQLLAHLVNLMDAIVATPTLEIRQLNYLNDVEKDQLLVAFNNTTAVYPEDKTIIDLFEEQVAKTPDAIALVYGNKEFTYNELNAKANEFGHYLREKHLIKAEDLIGIKLERNDSMLMVLLGILKSGGAYLPIDMDYPSERIAYMLADSKCKLLIDEEILKEFNALESGDLSQENLSTINTANNLAYVIYTSGSTGNPKGVMIEHSNAVAFISWCKEEFSNSRFDTVFAVTSICFDLSIFELLYTLCIGKKIRLLSNALAVPQYLDTKEDILLNMVPSAVGALLNEQVDFSQVKVLNMAGEPIPEKYLASLDIEAIEIRNLYGPSEDTTYSSIYQITNRNVPILIGHPIANTQFYILNSALQPQSVGVLGEIYISGKGLARGYLHKADLTAEKFIENPFAKGERMYKTGDLGKWQNDGNIEFLGRIDDQVKIRGYRIELGEIENTLEKHPQIEAACVLAHKNSDGQNEVVAYFVSEKTVLVAALRKFIGESLPSYMIPAHWVKIDQMPLTPNGKIDKKKLPAPEAQEIASDVEYITPRNEREEKLLAIWQEVLKKDKISVLDNFFELGGNSLKAIQLLSRLTKSFDIELGMRALFTNPTIEKLSNDIETAGIHKIHAEINKIAEQESYTLSVGQKRLWILSQFEETNTAYNMPGVYVFNGDLNIEALGNAFSKLIDRHEILRTVFKQNDQEEVRQFILSSEDIGFHLEYKDIRKESKPREILEQEVQSVFGLPFNLKKGPLLRAAVYQTETNQFVFAYAMHHIISDGWSMGILIKELLHLYNSGDSLPALPIQYKDYSAWQNQQLSAEDLKGHKGYWLNQFEGTLPVLELGQGNVRPVVQTFNGGIVSKIITPQTSSGIKKISQEENGTLFMGVLAVVNTLLYRYSNQQDIIIGSPIAGREHADLENQIGFYVNTLALRTRFKAEDNFINLLKEVKEVTLGAYEHQLYPFDELVDALNLHRDMSRNPLFDVMVMLQNNESNQESNPSLGDLQVSSYEGSTAVVSKFDFTFNFEDLGDTLLVSLEYNSDIYTQKIADQLLAHLVNLMDAIVATPTLEIRQLNYLSDVEKEQLLISFNDTESPYPKDKTIMDLFEEQVAKTPDAIALVYGNKEFTYNELNAKANEFGHYLREKQLINAEDLIGIKLERNDSMLVVLLGILKSGGAYLPIDMDYPSERIAYMLADSKCKLLIDEEVLKEFNALNNLSQENLSTINTANNLAYVIYTSGSTGNPKGVMIEHSNAVAFISWCKEEFSNSRFDTVFAVTSICFDLSIFELLYTLCIGKKIRLLSNALAVPQYLDTKEDILLNMVPSAVGALLNEQVDFSQVKVLNMAGEPIPEKYLASLDIEAMEIRNLYGPSEDTTYSSIYQITNRNVPILIGHPIANTQFYILNSALQPQPIGVLGEIYISGKGLARGYLHKADLTAEKFIENPFAKGERMYKTGDLGKWQNDGNIEFLGRIDDQVKIRGYRIELGEIENTLEKHPDIASACVLAHKNSDGQNEVVAYFVGEKTVPVADLRKFIGESLPSYMIPAHWIKIDQMPLTPNGKIDKKKLPAPEAQEIASDVEYITPRNEREEKLLAIWQEVLKKDKISVLDNFFELGGNSLKALKVHSLILKTTHLPLKLQDIYHNPTIEALGNTKTGYTALLNLENKADIAAKNIYFVPPVIGNSMLYKPLTQMLGEGFNCFGFQYSGLEKEEPLFESIEQAASVFCEQLISNQKNDDIILVGYSMGGNIAFEMAKILEKKNLNVSLVLIDSVAKIKSNDSFDYETETDWLVKQYRILTGKDEVQEESLRRFLNNNFQIFNKYEQTGRIKNKLCLFEAKGNYIPLRMKNWSNFTTGDTMHEYIEGGHWDALNKSNLEGYKKAIIELTNTLIQVDDF